MMRQSFLFTRALREAPADAEAASHKLLVRAGFIRQLASGVYSYMPLGLRVLAKIETIIRQEMERAGVQEILLPSLQPAELWQQSGRIDVYGPELIRLDDRGNRSFVLGPTHEEAVTALIGRELSSYRQLPTAVFQIQTKFRDEQRPRAGLLRCREFVMKDAYSFAEDEATLGEQYARMYAAYERIFRRCGLNVRAVEADAGAIGGAGGSHEFMAYASMGEDTVISCPACGYAANSEKAVSLASQAGSEEAELVQGSSGSGQITPAAEKFYTPSLKTIDDLTLKLGLRPVEIVKTLLYTADNTLIAILVRGDHEANEAKIKQLLDVTSLELADTAQIEEIAGVPLGFVGPVSLNVDIYADFAVAAMHTAITGANEQDYHLKQVMPGRDFTIKLAADLRVVQEGEPCIHCSGALETNKGIEVAHIFKLGHKYSEPLHANFVDRDGRSRPIVMGCYGIGVSRLLAAIIEQQHDEDGMIWPVGVAPFQVHLLVMSTRDEVQEQLASECYERLLSAGIETLFDDRNERPGVKLKDADLLGMPLRVVFGKAAETGYAELKARDGSSEQIAIDDLVQTIKERLARD